MKNDFTIRKNKVTSARMAAALDLLIDFLLEEYGKESGVPDPKAKKKKKTKPSFHSNGTNRDV